jgi:hypothetical protein
MPVRTVFDVKKDLELTGFQNLSVLLCCAFSLPSPYQGLTKAIPFAQHLHYICTTSVLISTNSVHL